MRYKLLIIGLWLACFMLAVPVTAQPTNRLQVNIPVEGVITSDVRSFSWGFYGFQDQMLSFRVQATDGTLDPVLTIRNADGQRIIGNDDYDYPNTRDALIEGITIPRTGEYEVIISGFGETSGEFVLTMLPGYSSFVLDERFITQGDWIPDNVNVDVVDGIATLQAEGIAQTGLLVNPTLSLLDRHYVEIIIDSISSRNEWAVGLAVHYQDAQNYTGVLVNQRGEWRLVTYTDGVERIVREWGPHPAIAPAETAFRLGALVDGRTVSVFYNGLFVGRADDTASDVTGTVGLMAVTANALSSSISVQVDDLFITQPIQTADGFIFPTELIDALPRITAQELVRRGVMPSGGVMAWEIAESFQDSRAPGVSPLPLVEDTRFAEFAIGATVQMNVNRDEGIAACGLLFGYQSAEDYFIAYLDNVGGYGISQRTAQGFEDGLFGINERWNITQTSNLVLVFTQGIAHYFVNQTYVGGIELDPLNGQLGNVVVNFDPSVVSCQFRNTWAWRLDG